MNETNARDIKIAKIEAVAQIVSAAVTKGHPACSNMPNLIDAISTAIKRNFA